ncbi:MAG: methyltransferase [Candidatus Methanomethylophilaceae archaeon]|nr:methyltransferase [Candidatus Methanomethylophilaceae archaeon]
MKKRLARAMLYDPSLIIEDCPEVYSVDEDSILLIHSLDVRPGERVLEVGCGSGVVSIHCAIAGAEVTAVDINPYAVECTHRNATRNGVKMDVRPSDMYSNVTGRFDTIVFNLPYLPVEDEGLLAKAWSGGSTGVEPLERLLEGAADHLEPGGRVVVVASSLMTTEDLDSILSDYSVRVIGELSLFFEVLRVLEIVIP